MIYHKIGYAILSFILITFYGSYAFSQDDDSNKVNLLIEEMKEDLRKTNISELNNKRVDFKCDFDNRNFEMTIQINGKSLSRNIRDDMLPECHNDITPSPVRVDDLKKGFNKSDIQTIFIDNIQVFSIQRDNSRYVVILNKDSIFTYFINNASIIFCWSRKIKYDLLLREYRDNPIHSVLTNVQEILLINPIRSNDDKYEERIKLRKHEENRIEEKCQYTKLSLFVSIDNYLYILLNSNNRICIYKSNLKEGMFLSCRKIVDDKIWEFPESFSNKLVDEKISIACTHDNRTENEVYIIILNSKLYFIVYFENLMTIYKLYNYSEIQKIITVRVVKYE